MKEPILTAIEQRLYRTAWARGVYTQHLRVPGARPAQLRAGAKKILDIAKAQQRRAQRKAMAHAA